MHFVLRDWWGDDFDKCERNCCPNCGEVDPKEYAMGDVDYFNYAPEGV